MQHIINYKSLNIAPVYLNRGTATSWASEINFAQDSQVFRKHPN